MAWAFLVGKRPIFEQDSDTMGISVRLKLLNVPYLGSFVKHRSI